MCVACIVPASVCWVVMCDLLKSLAAPCLCDRSTLLILALVSMQCSRNSLRLAKCPVSNLSNADVFFNRLEERFLASGSVRCQTVVRSTLKSSCVPFLSTI